MQNTYDKIKFIWTFSGLCSRLQEPEILAQKFNMFNNLTTVTTGFNFYYWSFTRIWSIRWYGKDIYYKSNWNKYKFSIFSPRTCQYSCVTHGKFLIRLISQENSSWCKHKHIKFSKPRDAITFCQISIWRKVSGKCQTNKSNLLYQIKIKASYLNYVIQLDSF